jgi:hypothetical protein
MSDEYQSLPLTDQQVPVEFGPSAERGVPQSPATWHECERLCLQPAGSCLQRFPGQQVQEVVAHVTNLA